jgi:hypothetical protein
MTKKRIKYCTISIHLVSSASRNQIRLKAFFGYKSGNEGTLIRLSIKLKVLEAIKKAPQLCSYCGA